MDLPEFSAISDDSQSLSDWTVLSASPKALPKALPLPSCLSRSVRPRIASPFQVTQLASSSPAIVRTSGPVVNLQLPGLPVPQPNSIDRGSESFPAHTGVRLLNRDCGLAAPFFSQPTPQSLQLDSGDSQSLACDVKTVPEGLQFLSKRGLNSAPTPKPAVLRLSTAASALTRVRVSSTSPVVWKLWTQVISDLQDISSVIAQLQRSQYVDEHSARFLNQFAATTLVRYLTSLRQFLQLCRTMRVALSDLSDSCLADLLVCGALARRSDGSGPKCSVTLKALRWASKQLGIRVFDCAFGSLVASFEKQKLPVDRKESLPFPLFLLMKWERRILQAQASVKETIILGGFLMLCFTGLRFSDLQRSTLATWQLDDSSLRGLTWRAKTCSTCTPFGMVLSGFLSQGQYTWVHKFLNTLEWLYKGQDAHQIDFALPSFQDQDQPVEPFEAMSYAEALFYLRQYMTLPWSVASAQLTLDVSSYSLHGLKATLLSWAAQANLSENDRRMHGKHKPAQMSVQLYSRDDIEGSIRLQTTLISRVVQGWRPTTPLGRGGQQPLIEPQFVMERFRKQLPSFSWDFFQFHSKSQLQLFVDAAPHSDTTSALSDDVDSSSSSSSSSSSDSEIEQGTSKKSTKRPPTSRVDTVGPADEALFGLHRNTWHVMVQCQDYHSDLPSWQEKPLKTACGKSLSSHRIQVGFDLQLKSSQYLCSHAGCHKAFTSLDTD